MEKRIAICPGSFDPITKGHLDIIRRAAALFDEVIVLIMVNYTKAKTAFTAAERVEMARRVTADIPNVRVDYYAGLLADYAGTQGACTLVKGLRAVTDFEYEFQMALTTIWRPSSSPPTSSICTCPVRWCGRWPASAATSRNSSAPRCWRTSKSAWPPRPARCPTAEPTKQRTKQ